MDHRGQESPMDFQWENSSGRVDPNSPFRMTGIERTSVQGTPAKKGGTSVFFRSSPTKPPVFPTVPNGAPPTSTPSTPFGKPPRPPQPSFHTPAYMTPRHSAESPSKDSDIFSTPGDSLDTDTEAPTPESQLAQLLRSGGRGGISSLALAPGRVSGRGELRRKFDGAINKPRRRRLRRAEFDRDTEDDESNDDDDGEYLRRSKAGPRPFRSPSSRSRATEWLHTHQNIPAVVSGYLHLLMHASAVGLVVYLLFAIFRVVRDDMDHRVQEAALEVSAQIAKCQKHYVQNRCAPDLRVPAMEAPCAEWERCMNTDPAKVGRAKVSAATIAEILNGFVNELHWKTMGLIVFVVICCWVAGNVIAPKVSHAAPPAPPPPPPHYMPAASPSASHWTPHPPAQSHHYQQREPQPWATPLTKSRARPFGYQALHQDDGDGDGDGDGEKKSLEWR